LNSLITKRTHLLIVNIIKYFDTEYQH